MKIAASDYDGTLFRHEKISQGDVEGVRLWREAGNKFGVVTGRDYGMLAPQLKYYGIESDYAVCNNGGLICRADGTPLWQGEIPLKVLAELAEDPGVDRSFHYAFSAADKTYLYHEREGSWISREAKQWDFHLVEITERDILQLPQIHQFSLGYKKAEEALEVSESINERFGQIVHAYPNRCSVDITPLGISKRQGIDKLVELMGWQDAVIYAIGDEVNDLPMLEAFEGFTVDSAREGIQAKAKYSYASVGAMLQANL